MRGSPVEGKDVWDVKKLLEVSSMFNHLSNDIIVVIYCMIIGHNIPSLYSSQQFSVDIADNASKVCLAHLFTYQDFDEGTLGLAYVAPSKAQALGGLCPKREA